MQENRPGKDSQIFKIRLTKDSFLNESLLETRPYKVSDGDSTTYYTRDQFKELYEDYFTDKQLKLLGLI